MKGRWLLLGVALLAVFGLAMLTVPVNAQSSGLQDVTVSVPAGQTVRLPVELWCLDFGKPFPKDVTGPAGPASANALAVAQAAYSGGQAMSDPYQTQLAVWYAVDGTWHDQAGKGHAVAQQIVSKAGISAGAASTATATAVSTVGSTNTNLKVTVENLTAIPDTNNAATPYHGTATLVIQNTGNSDANFTFTQGATFKPATNAEQTLIGVSAGTSAQATATTTVSAPAAAVTTTTVATTAPTVAATATTAATTAPTVAATATPVTVETLTPVAQATSTVTPGNLPATGGSDGSMSLVLILGGLMILVGGALALRQSMIRR